MNCILKRKQQFLINKNPRTYDFTNMYTGLEHERIKKNVREAIREAKQYAAELFARDTKTPKNRIANGNQWCT